MTYLFINTGSIINLFTLHFTNTVCYGFIFPLYIIFTLIITINLSFSPNFNYIIISRSYHSESQFIDDGFNWDRILSIGRYKDINCVFLTEDAIILEGRHLNTTKRNKTQNISFIIFLYD